MKNGNEKPTREDALKILKDKWLDRCPVNDGGPHFWPCVLMVFSETIEAITGTPLNFDKQEKKEEWKRGNVLKNDVFTVVVTSVGQNGSLSVAKLEGDIQGVDLDFMEVCVYGKNDDSVFTKTHETLDDYYLDKFKPKKYNTEVDVTKGSWKIKAGDKTEEIQKALFALGLEWRDCSKSVLDYAKFLCIDDCVITFSSYSRIFKEDERTKIKYRNGKFYKK